MKGHFLGVACSLLAALVWAFAMILFKRSGERTHPLALNLFKNAIAIVLLVATLWIMGEGIDSVRTFAAGDIWILVLSGFLGITLSDTVFFYSLNLVGVGLVSVVDCLYCPFIIFFSWFLLSEKLAFLQYTGAGLVLLAVLISSRHEPPPGRTRGTLLLGILLGICSMGLLAFGIVIAKPVLSRFDTIWAAFIRIVAGTTALIFVVLALPHRRSLFSVFRPSRDWKVSVPGSVLGAYVALTLWIAGYKYTHASVAGILNQTSAIFGILLAALLLKEALTRRKLSALILAMAGILLVSLG